MSPVFPSTLLQYLRTNRESAYGPMRCCFFATIVVVVGEMGSRASTRSFLRTVRRRKKARGGGGGGKRRIPRKWQSSHSFPLHCSLESVESPQCNTASQWRLRSNGKTRPSQMLQTTASLSIWRMESCTGIFVFMCRR